MIDGAATDLSDIERLRRRIARAVFGAVIAGLLAGLACYFWRRAALSTVILTWTVGVLLVPPIVNIVAVLAEEVRQRDWAFAWLAVAVLSLLAYAVAYKVLATLESVPTAS